MSKWKLSVFAVLTLIVSRSILVGAQAPPGGKSSTLTAQDYIEIQQLVSRYAYALDSGADNGYMYAGLFTADAEFHGPPATPGGKPFNARGRDQLAGLARGGRRAGPFYARHFLTNHLIEPSAEGATGKVYLLVIDIAEEGTPTTVNMGGHYEDIYVKTPEGWRFKRREFFRSKSAAPPAPSAPSR